MLDAVTGREDPRPVMAVAVDDRGVVRLTWATGLHITEHHATAAMQLVDRVNDGTERPLLVDMAGTASLARPARMVFGRRCSASRIALLGKSPVDRVIANFALGVSAVPVPTRFFTSEPLAMAWLCRDDVGA